MRRWIVGAGMLMSGVLVSCGGGPPAMPQSATVAPVTTESSATTGVDTATATMQANTESITTATIEATAESTAAAIAETTLVPTNTSEPTADATEAPTGTAEATAEAALAPRSTTEATSAPDAGSVQPLGIAACEQLWGEVAQTLGVDVERSTAAFQNERVGSGTSCHLVANGTGAQFKPFPEVSADLRTLFAARGWMEDQSFLADGPTGTAAAYRQGNALALVSVGWEPAEGVNCTGPIVDCNISPEQQNFTVSIDLVQSVE